MSNPIRYDPLLVRYLADELNRRLQGRSCSPLPVFSADRVATLSLDGGEVLHMDLHPRGGTISIRTQTVESDRPTASIVGVYAPADERCLALVIEESSRFRLQHRRLIVELLDNQWNALVTDDTGTVQSALWSRQAGSRTLRSGEPYEPPPYRVRLAPGAADREVLLGEWIRLLGGTEPSERAPALVRNFAWTSSWSARALLAAVEDGRPDGLEASFERWYNIARLPAADPVLLRTARGTQPYPLALPGVPSAGVSSLLQAMERVASPVEMEEIEIEGWRDAARERLEAVRRKIESLRSRLPSEEEIGANRHRGDLLLARLHLVPRGANSVRLAGWEGEPVEVELDPALGPAENAEAWYERARRLRRAAERVPPLVERAEMEEERWRSVVESETLPSWARAELERASADAPKASEPSLPYRRYRTSGGLEVRVGRSAKDNDRLTFGHAAPTDVWLHARSVPGSHVVLRWQNPDSAPPARDLSEAAALAALFSKARTSGIVPVDWTRRKYVRKPRGAPAGAVVPQQVKTLFVEPDEELEERLRELS